MVNLDVEGTIRQVSVLLRSAGIEGAASDARLLVAHVRQGDSAFADLLTAVQRHHLDRLVRHRARRAPLAQVIGVREFWSLDFEVTVDTLTPRPDSETLITCCLDHFAARYPTSILDLGTGSGCLLVTLLAIWKQSRGLGIDLSGPALAVARRNARRHGVLDRAAFIQSDWNDAIDGCFDLVVTNPPYVRTGDISTLDPEVAVHEPGMAIDGGSDGLDCYRRIVPHLVSLLSAQGVAVLEHAPDQGPQLVALADAFDLGVMARACDLGGFRRALVLGRKAA